MSAAAVKVGLDTSVDADAEELWIEEAQRRYDSFVRGELQGLPGDEVMRRVRSRLKWTSVTSSI